MVVKNRAADKNAPVKRYAQIFMALGAALTLLGFIASFISLFTESVLLNVILFLEAVWGIGVFLFAYGLAVIQGKRWHIFGLLVFVFFGSLVAGLLSMVGRETNAGYYIWAVGALVSLSLIVILIVFWEKLLDG